MFGKGFFMNVWKGKAISGGIAVGNAGIYRRKQKELQKKHIEDYEAEREKYAAVKSLAIDELEKLFKKAKSEIGEDEAQIFSIHKMMVEDAYYNESVLQFIEKQRVSAEAAVLMTSDGFERLFHDMDSAYMRERASDIRDVSDRIVALLGGSSCPYPEELKENTVLFAENIAPSEAFQMDKKKVCAFVTELGSATSHTAILARSLGIPAVAGIKISENIDGKRVAVDGYTGTVYIEPDDELIEKLKNEERERFSKVGKKEALSRAKISADIQEPEEMKLASAGGFDGVGIFRSEALYKRVRGVPSEAYQFDAYRKIAEGAGKSAVSIRTLDVDTDKKGDFFGIFKEKNPSLGMKAIRLCLLRPELFKTQLRAILRASVCGKIQILLPMITSVDEVREAKKILAEAKRELAKSGESFDANIPVGVMIETPAAVLISDKLAQEAEFFMIDADLLAQYLLAMDRQNPILDGIMDMRHTAVLRAIEITVENAKKSGISVALCGAIAQDTELSDTFLKMGITEFSLRPKNSLPLKNFVQ